MALSLLHEKGKNGVGAVTLLFNRVILQMCFPPFYVQSLVDNRQSRYWKLHVSVMSCVYKGAHLLTIALDIFYRRQELIPYGRLECSKQMTMTYYFHVHGNDCSGWRVDGLSWLSEASQVACFCFGYTFALIVRVSFRSNIVMFCDTDHRNSHRSTCSSMT